jgi:hypothetical protein
MDEKDYLSELSDFKAGSWEFSDTSCKEPPFLKSISQNITEQSPADKHPFLSLSASMSIASIKVSEPINNRAVWYLQRSIMVQSS